MGLSNNNSTDQPSNMVISGEVLKCSNGDPFSGVTVTASKDGNKLASTTTGEDGTYNLSFQSDDEVFILTASYPGHKSSSKEVVVSLGENNSSYGTADFQLGVTTTYVDDNWVGLPAGTVVFFPGDPNHHIIGVDAFATISDGVTNANPGGTVHIADGVGPYTGPANRGITINKDLTIIGQSPAGTVIDAQGQGRIFYINSGVTVNLYNLTLKNGYLNPDNGGAIYNAGTLTVTGCTFTNNTALKSVSGGGYVIGGSGGAIYNAGYLTVTGSIFTDNTADNGGGAIENAGTSTVISSTFANNQAPCGGAIDNPNTCTLTVTDSIFNNNAAEEEGGAIYNFAGTLTVTGSIFTGNVLTNLLSGNIIFGGSAISNVFGNSAQVHFNQIVGNSPSGGEISSIGAVMDATFNWWGSNSSPAGEIASKSGGTVLFDPWIILTVTANPTTINFGGTSQITADLLHDSSLAHTYHNPADGHVPDGIPITLTLSPVLGTITNIIPSSSTTLNGKIDATYHTGSLPIQTPVRIYANVDSEQVYTDINIPIPTILTVNNPQGYNGDTVNIIATLTRTDTGAGVAGKLVTITVNGQTYTATTDSNGQITWAYTINNMDAGPYTITTTFAGDTQCEASNGAGTLTVKKIITSLNLNGPIGYNGDTVNITATLTRADTRTAVAGKFVTITLNGQTYQGYTDANGQLTWTYSINNMDAGFYNIFATFAGDTQYRNSDDGDLLMVKGIPTSLTVNNAGGIGSFKGQTMNIQATLRDIVHSDAPVSGKTIDFTITGDPTVYHAVTDVNGVAILVYTIVQNAGTCNIHATFAGDTQYRNSSSNPDGILTVDKIPTNLAIDNVRGNKDETVTLKAILKDYYGTPLTGKIVEFWVAGVKVGENTTDINGTAVFNYKITKLYGNHTTEAKFNEDTDYLAINAAGQLYVPESDLYIKITSNKNNPKVGETFTLTYKLGNDGPDAADNVTITIPLPEGFEISQITGDGNWTYNETTKTITWTFANVPKGDPYLYISGKVLGPGNYLFSSSISSRTYSINSEGVTPITINAVNEVKAASKTIPLRHTGLPLAGLVLAILAVFGGLLIPKRKN